MAHPSLAARLGSRLEAAISTPRIGRLLAAVFHNRIPNRGCLIATDSPRIIPPIVAQLFWGLYEGPELALVRRYLPPDRDVLELGSSIGVGSAHMARRLRPTQRLICVEANPHLLSLIEQNVTLNTAGCELVVVPQAVDYSGQATVRFDIQEMNTNSAISRDGAGVEVAATTVSRLIAQFSLQAFTLVADIEGAEVGLILRDAAALSQVQMLVIELHTAEDQGVVWTPDQLCAALIADHHFRLLAARGQVYVFDRPASLVA